MTSQTQPHQAIVRVSWPALLDTTLLGAIGVMLLAKISRGLLAFYIHPRYTWLVVACAIVLIVIGALRSRDILSTQPEPLAGRGIWYLLLAVPLLFGITVPAKPLDSTLLASRGTDLTVAPRAGQSSGWNAPRNKDTLQWNLLDWTTALSLTPEEAVGKPVNVEGFVFRDQNRPSDAGSFYLARYVVTCCAADGNGVGLPVVWPGGEALASDSWVRIRGTLGETTVAGKQQPAIIASSVEPIAQPRNPYLYP